MWMELAQDRVWRAYCRGSPQCLFLPWVNTISSQWVAHPTSA